MARPAAGEVLARVVDDRRRAQGLHQGDVAGAADPGHGGPEHGGERHGEGADPAGRPDDQHALPGGDPAPRQAEVGGGGGQGERGGLLERQPRGLGRQCALRDGGVLGEGRLGLAEHLVADLPPGDPGPEGLDGPGEVAAADPLARPGSLEGAGVHQPGDPLAAHGVPVGGVHRGRGDPHEHLTGCGLRWVDVLDPEHVGRPVDVLHQCLHDQRR